MTVRKYVKRISSFLFVIVLALILFQTEPGETKPKKVYVLTDAEIFGTGVEWNLIQNHFPFFKYLFHNQNESSFSEILVSNISPLYRYLLNQEVIVTGREQKTELAVGEEIEKRLLQENADIEEKTELQIEDDTVDEPQIKELYSTQNTEGQGEAIQSRKTDVASIFFELSDFKEKEEKQREYDWTLFSDPKMVRKEFFAVDATTEITDERIIPEKLLEKEIGISESNGGPQILIYHTHSQETFIDSIPGDENTSIVGAGKYLTKLLQEKYGFEVLHHTGEYDVETRDYAYSYALPNIEAILKEYPSIEVVIDLHRDAVAEDRKLVSEQNGRQAAQVMFFNGLSYTKKQGEIGYLENPYIDDNLAFSFQMQTLCNEYYPGLTRRIYLKGYRYNMHLCSKSLLIELGAQTNTCEEARNSLDIIAHALSMCLAEESDAG